MKLPSDECHWTSPMISQHWFMLPDDTKPQGEPISTQISCRHMASLGHTELKLCAVLFSDYVYVIRKFAFRVADNHAHRFVNSSPPPEQNGHNFPDNIFKCIFVNEKLGILIKISLKLLPKGPINNNPALV